MPHSIQSIKQQRTLLLIHPNTRDARFSLAPQALQSVEPGLTVPYWDYTRDSVEIAKTAADAGRDAVDSSIFKNSVLFTKDFFGATDSEAHTVTEGRFAHVEVPVIRGAEQEAADTVRSKEKAVDFSTMTILTSSALLFWQYYEYYLFSLIFSRFCSWELLNNFL